MLLRKYKREGKIFKYSTSPNGYISFQANAESKRMNVTYFAQKIGNINYEEPITLTPKELHDLVEKEHRNPTPANTPY